MKVSSRDSTAIILKMLRSFMSGILVSLGLLLVLHKLSAVDSAKITIPDRCRTEGRLSFTVPENEDNDPTTSTYHLAFTESIDSIERRSVVSIGYVAYEPTKYFMRDGLPPVTLGSDGSCTSTPQSLFVPELAWLVERLVPGNKISRKDPHLSGPTGLLDAVQKILDKTTDMYMFNRTATHRNIPCDIYSKALQIPDTDLTLKVEVYSPSAGVKIRNWDTTYFSVSATILDPKVQQDDENRRKSFMIDFFNIESADKNPEKFDSMLNDFNLPFARGCSEFLTQLPTKIKSDTFSMKYGQASESSFILMAYDHLSGYLRKEMIGGSVSIWDLNEDLLYHIDNDVPSSLEGTTTYKGNAESCSVMSVLDEGLSPAFRPYEVNGESLNVLTMIGAEYVSYLGRGSVRELPCLVYEIILDKPPLVFGFKDEDLSLNIEKTTEPKLKKDYIVQFHVLEGEKIKNHETTPMPANFWPARIVLYRRYKSLGLIDMIDQLDILDFYWSLDGWDKKGSKLFMASECFDDEDEQLSVELALTFDRAYQNQAKHSDALILAYNKFKLESELINDIFRLFEVSKMHLVEYELKLRPNHVNLNMIIGDRKEDKKLLYYGEGQLPSPDSYKTNRVDFFSLDEESCVLESSHITDISMVVYCPPDLKSHSDQVCTAVYDENEPTVTKNLEKPLCHVYMFQESTIPNRAVGVVHDKSNLLYRHPFKFEADTPAGKDERRKEKEILEGSIRNYDVTHEIKLITVENYGYTLDADQDNINPQEQETGVEVSDGEANHKNPRVRSFESSNYQSEGDCARLCNLDVTCRSYSYCSYSKTTSNDGRKNQCVLSSLDVRASRLIDQLVHMVALSANKQTIVRDGDQNKYKLQFSDECNIYERDYLNMFRRTEEIIRLDASLASQFQTAPTTFECAKQSVDLEFSSKATNHHVAMFAYCANSNTLEGRCLLDENLFVRSNVSANGDSDKEILCRVYRKKYQTYFKISGQVLKEDPKQQVELSLNTVEECARACWIRLGQVCASFDHCSPGRCLVNTMSTPTSNIGLESRANCLHYERDMSLDELRKQHLIGQHDIYQGDSRTSTPTTFWGVILGIFTYGLVICAFFYGLVLGNQVNDKLASTGQPLGRRLTLVGSNAVASAQQLFGFAGFANHDYHNDYDDDDHDDSPYPNDERAIQMDVIPRTTNHNRDSISSGFANVAHASQMIEVNGRDTDKQALKKDF